MSTTKRTKVILSVAMTLSLALNFFFLGWLVGSSPFVPGPPGGPFGRDDGMFGPTARDDRMPEMWFIDFVTMGMSDNGRRQILEAVEKHADDIRTLKEKADEIRRETVATLLEDKPDSERIRQEVKELEGIMQQRLAAMHDTLIPVVAQLDPEDRRTFATRWESGPGGKPPPPRPPR